MSAFNKAQYNRSRFNVGKEAGEVSWMKGLLAERVTASASNATINFISHGLREAITGEAVINNGVYITGKASEVVTAASARYGYFYIKRAPVLTIQGDCVPSIIAMMTGSAAETVTADAAFSQSIRTSGALAEVVEAETAISQDVRFPHTELDELILGSTDIEATEEMICYLNVTLKPGQELIIDAGTYNMSIDGENFIHAQSGAWLDDLNRNTQRIQIEGVGADNLTASVLYTERYL